MDMLSLNYAILCAAILLLFQLSPARYRPALLSVASFLIYALYSVMSSAILLGLTIAVFVISQRIERAATDRISRSLLLGSISVLLAYLFLIKIIPVLRGSNGHSSPGTRVLTAVGVSYFTFKLLGYVVDIYWGKYPAWRNFARFSAFVAFFPQLPAGPIQRANEWFIASPITASSDCMVAGFRRILLGYVKKVVIADQLGSMIAFIASVQPEYGNLTWIAAYVYAIQLYADFSALTDIALGTASLLGVTSPENFDFPFFAPSISQFWRRWHMSLTRWLTDYVFTPVRMASRNLRNWGLALSITINMVLIGLWHGFTIGFLLFGLLNSVYLIADGLTAQHR